MSITVEFFGIARARAGVACTTADGHCLGEVLEDLARQFPELAASCIEGQQLRPGFTANIGGECFVTASETPLVDGQSVLIMSLDAGG